MPFTPTEVQVAAKSGLDLYLKNSPIDQISQNKPLLNFLQKGKESFAGAKEYVVEQLRTNYGSNATWFSGSGSGTIGYNTRDSLGQVKYTWYQLHDGLEISEDKLRANGIQVSDSAKPKSASQAERIQLTNLWKEQCEILHEGLQTKFDQALHLNGSGNANQLIGLDGLLGTANNTGTIGSIDRATATWWRHYTDLTLNAATMLSKMEKAWRECTRRGGAKPDKILAGQNFIDAYKAATLNASGAMGIQRTMETGKGGSNIDAGVNGVYFKGVEIEWDPTMDDNVGGMDTPAVPWSDRCYFLNSKTIKLRPLDGDDFTSRDPQRDKGAYAVYVAILWRGALTLNKSNANAVLALAQSGG